MADYIYCEMGDDGRLAAIWVIHKYNSSRHPWRCLLVLSGSHRQFCVRSIKHQMRGLDFILVKQLHLIWSVFMSIYLITTIFVHCFCRCSTMCAINISEMYQKRIVLVISIQWWHWHKERSKHCFIFKTSIVYYDSFNNIYIE